MYMNLNIFISGISLQGVKLLKFLNFQYYFYFFKKRKFIKIRFLKTDEFPCKRQTYENFCTSIIRLFNIL